MNDEDSLLQLQQQLRDIREPDAVSPWPPGPGWWLTIVLVLLAAAAARALLRHWHWSPRRLRFNQRWQRDASRQLHDLKHRLDTGDSRALADEFAALLRRIAVARHGRPACASLTGQEWVGWLSANDPAGFDWTQHRRLLSDLAYAPPSNVDHSDELRVLIQAALAWTRATSTAGDRQRPDGAVAGTEVAERA